MVCLALELVGSCVVLGFSVGMDNKTALAMIEHWRFWLWETKKTPKLLSVRQAMERCEQPRVALECLCCALGLLD